MSGPFSLGKRLSSIRTRRKWTLREMSHHTGIPFSTLAKVEHDRSTLTYDKLVQVSQRLNVGMSEFFSDWSAIDEPAVTARRSIGALVTAKRINSNQYDCHYLCPELRNKRMIPILIQVRAEPAQESCDLVSHPGEEFVYVLGGRINVLTEFYDPCILNAGESIYIDGNMGHAYVAAHGCDEATVLALCSTAEAPLTYALDAHAAPTIQCACPKGSVMPGSQGS
ncbi:MAG TPA: cupin domain-containing protein [Steroidobacteraceae bacterium]